MRSDVHKNKIIESRRASCDRNTTSQCMISSVERPSTEEGEWARYKQYDLWERPCCEGRGWASNAIALAGGVSDSLSDRHWDWELLS